MNSVQLYYIKHQGERDLAQIDEAVVNGCLDELPAKKKTAIQRLLNKRDQISSLLGLYLLKKYAADENLAGFRLSDIEYPDKAKPCWKKHSDVFDFNISHSDNLVLMAASQSLKVGIDAEKIRPLKSLKFAKVMTPDELDQIQLDPALFFDLWSKKEAVVKAADTAGLSRMRDVQVDENRADLDNQAWHLTNIQLAAWQNNEYAIHLATSGIVEKVMIKQVLISELIS